MRLQHSMAALLVAVVGMGWGTGAWADSVVEGNTFTVAGYILPGGTIPIHFHSLGNGLAEVGAFTGWPEEVRGLSEYSLAGVKHGPAYVSFDVDREGGLFVPRDPMDRDKNNWPFDGIIDVYAYVANGQADLADFDAPSIGLVGSFNTSGLQVGETLSFDVKHIVKELLKDGDAALGIRLQAEGGAPANGGAYTFTNFRLLDSRYEAVAVVPLPSPVWGGLMLLGGMAVQGAWRRRS